MSDNISSIVDFIHPTVSGIGVFLSDQVWVLFDREMDESSLLNNLFLEGPDFDTWSGPDLALYLNTTSIGSENEILQSPDYHGIVQGSLSFEKIDLLDSTLSFDGLDVVGSGILWRTKAIFTPILPLTADTPYRVYLAGDEDTTDTLKTGISTRTVYDALVDIGNTGDNEVIFTGGYDATYGDIFYVEITTGGAIGTARFKYWRDTNPTAITGLLARRGGTLLSAGVVVSFDETIYVVGDIFSCVVKPRDTFTGNLSWGFLTGAGSIQTIPTETATSIVGDTVITSGDTATLDTFSVMTTSPVDETSHQTIEVGPYDIIIDFNTPIDSSTVASGISVTVFTESVNGDTSITASVLCIAEPTVNGSRLTVTVASGFLLENNLVTITLDSSIASTGGVLLGTDYEFWFTTAYNPYYCSLKRVRLNVGAYIPNIPNDTINFALFEASLAANALTWNTSASSSNTYYNYVRTQWTCCKAQETLLLNALRGEDRLKSKQLGDLKVEYYQAASDALDQALNCMAKLETALQTGGESVQKPKMFIKGELDPDRPPVGRGWFNSQNDKTPVSNTRIQNTFSRRYRNGYVKPFRGKGRYS